MRRSLVLLAGWIVLLCGSSWATESSQNLLLITIDTLRADHLGCNGATEVQTPHMDRLASRGVNFTRARSPVPLTLPAHASILTGSYPPTHGVRDNGSYSLGVDHQTLAEVLEERGFETAAFVASFVLDRRFGLSQGFSSYDDRVWGAPDEIESLEAERPGGEVVSVFAEWMGSRDPSPPFFAWVHLYDPHAPYEPPEPFRSQYPSDPYAGEVAYTDQLVGQIVEVLETAGKSASTVIALVGDHGEGLGEHGEATHSLLIYNSTLHVPMLIYAPGQTPVGRGVGDLVRIIDLAPTVLDYLGLPSGFGEGVSLKSRIEGSLQARQEELNAYGESLYPEQQLGWSALRGLETSESRLILAPEPELFDLASDPGEKRNIARTDTSRYQRLKAQIGKVLESFEETAPSARVVPDPQIQARLRSLGYVGGSASPARSRSGPRVDPKTRLDVWNEIQTGMAAFHAGAFLESVRRFEAVLAEDPEILMAYEYLGSAWLELSDRSRAKQIYSKALVRGLDSAEIRRRWGGICASEGDLACAQHELELAVALEPTSVQAHYELAQIYRRVPRLGEAVEQYQMALELNPEYLWAWNGLAMSLASQGKTTEALEAFETVVEIHPEGALGYFNLAVHLDRSAKPTQAREAYERFMELSEGEGLELQRQQAHLALQRLED